jgi:hypothetical protein
MMVVVVMMMRMMIMSRFRLTIDGFLDWWMDLLTTLTHDSELQAVNSATDNLHNSQITTAHAKDFPAYYIFNRSLATDSNSGDCSASRTPVHSSQTPIQKSVGRPTFLPYNFSAWTP